MIVKSKAYFLVFDGLADWEAAHALCEINKSKRFQVVATGFSREPVTTMGGVTLVPDNTIDELNPGEAAIFIMPGGDMWQEQSQEEIVSLLPELQAERVVIAAICAATLEIARAGLTRNVHHTSNSKEYLKAMVPDYMDEQFYVDELAVMQDNIITASGLGSVEFTREIIKALEIYDEPDTQRWFDMFKRGVFSPP
jgi:putative intracellular protease/amidase